ncbi:branched-chain amino acid ABC transporter permease [Tianweitania sediminis]|jgi:branched-subunit amino acid ABC-type transport system permease component|uniref:Branched-chain amino acid ABC transporter permease n=1 Tax=Tianweitania sediminis TaxID=1502156 RepID=A0A8J7UKF4_9HYPH|nr:branched-chain amino acid ABC transporter permease [Tianweitania sediminis]MBP0438307.1 branched-chain amino acid ABC transporter permease [Tianweitania sediminis]HEV7416464.1 branched-chain amino acid ABC transporter permease [Tianweitania sediminis]
MTGDLLTILFNAMTWSMATFLVASGLTIVFGILHVLNFSHGGFFMIGAYVAYTVLNYFGFEIPLYAYLGGALVAAVAMGVVGVGVDAVVFRRLQNVEGVYVLIATYALLLVCDGFVKLVWGLNYLSVSPPNGLLDAIFMGDAILPTFSLFVIGCGLVVFLLLEGVLNHTSVGRTLQAIAIDPWMARAVGIDVSAVYRATVVAGFALAGLAGGLLVANQSLSPELAHIYILQAFGVVIIGGMGSIRGAFVASIFLGFVEAVSATYLPNYPGVLFFATIALVLVIRPQGLLGKEATA